MRGIWTAVEVMRRVSRVVCVIVAALLATAGLPGSAAHGESRPQAARLRALPVDSKPWSGDFQAMAERRMIRVLVPFSRSLYFADRGRERGLAAELVRDFETHINRRLRTGKRPITVYIVPTARDKLLPGLVDGIGDIAVGNLTVTAERMAVVDFVTGGAAPVNEVLVTGSRAPAVASLDDLAGMRVHVRPSSSYRESLEALSRRFAAEGRPTVEIVPVPDGLEDEDMMEMANAGLIGAIVVDDWKAKLWARVLPRVRVRDDIVLRADGRIGWATRKDSPQLAAAIETFFADPKATRESTAARLAAYHRGIRQMKDPTGDAEWRRFESTVALFETFGTRYGFEPLLLQAQGYQESRLDQGARSAHGAIGVMQVMPDTGRAMRVGDIAALEANIHAGAKYMDHLISRHFADASFSDANRALFAFAAYNAGPSRIARMRALARTRGLDPDKWFNNVEIVVAEKIGAESTHYVRNIYKYYVTYRLIAEADAARRAALRAAGGN
jgi:membrane-bound lytic murein transglycosylase MltF